jgi:hypothetical protein
MTIHLSMLLEIVLSGEVTRTPFTIKSPHGYVTATLSIG